MLQYRLLLTSALASTCWLSAVHAQEATAPGTEEIIVTGEKSDRTLQQTTSSVGVTTAKRIAQENLQSIQEVYQRTANLSETYGASGFSIRGIDQRGVSGGSGAATATVFVDGAPVPQDLLSNGPTDLWDVAQVEIFRGPQSTLQGLNALAGAVHIRTEEPSFDWRLKGQATVASFNTTQFAVAGGGPLIADQLAFRVSAEKRDSDGFIYNVTRRASENPVNSLSLRGKLLWTPSALPGLEARLNYHHFHTKGGYRFTYVDRNRPDYLDNPTNSSNFPNDSDVDSDQGTLDLRYRLGKGFSLTALSTYTNTGFMRHYDGDASAADRASSELTGTSKTFTQELRLNYESARLSGLVGLFYYNRDETANSQQTTLVPTPAATIANLLKGSLGATAAAQVASTYTQALPYITVAYTSDLPQRVQTYALFADGRYRVTERLSLLGGFRVDRERNGKSGITRATFAGTLPTPASYGTLAPVITAINRAVLGLVSDANGTAPFGARTFNAFLPKGGIEMAWTPDLSTAFVAQRGYRSGGSSFNTARSTLFAYDPEHTWNYELSLRSAWFGGKLTANANIYYIDWKNQQTTANFGNGNYDTNTVNAGKSHLYGFEVELSHRVSRAFDWYASVGHTRTKFDAFVTSIGSITDLSGNQFTYAPRWTLAGGANLRVAGGFEANLNVNYRSSVFTDVSRPQSAYRVGPRTLVNGRIGYRVERWGASLFVNNLFDKKYDQYVNPLTNQAIVGTPRTVGAMLGFAL
ncbi:TonB-dependent receptor [uncultured Sphingomonas sp.]|uniref:TonB-dependent receptor n=1 Tax=uncultured Sphingomonas sp. TaxID=158754 RepID=UPI0025FA34DB|nr:TonB-dependent receptor [uncultured Sphingomonas sp.]